MWRNYRPPLYLALVSSLSACSTLPVTGVPSAKTPAIDPADPQVGKFVYSLPATKIGIAGTVVLTSCKTTYDAANHRFEPALGINENFAAVPVIVGDPEATFAIAYDKARSPLKEINLNFTYGPGGAVASFNGTYNDQAGPTALAALLAGAKIYAGVSLPVLPKVGAVGGGNIGFAGKGLKRKPHKPAPPPVPASCTPVVVNALARIDADNAQILKDENDAAKQKLAIAPPEIANLQSEVARLQLAAGLVATFTDQWLPSDFGADGKVVAPKSYDIYSRYISHWLVPDAQKAIERQAATAEAQHLVDPIHDPIVVRVDLDSSTLGNQLPKQAVSGLPSHQTPGGFVIRIPAAGRLRICHGDCIAGDAGGIDTSRDVMAPANIVVGQAGRVLVLPLRNGVFETSNLTLAFNADSTVASMGNHSTGTLGTNLATLGGVGDTLASSAAAHNSEITADNTAILGQAQFPDLANKALSDCYVSAAAAKAAGAKTTTACE